MVQMSRTRIKICGVRDAATAQVAAAAGADAIGLVFAEGSPRQVDVEQARRIVEALPAWVDPVALFVAADTQRIRAVSAELGLRTVQLHGTPAEAAALAPLQVIKSISVGAAGVEEALAPWRAAPVNVAGLLFDAAPRGAELPGGTGRCFDWAALAALDLTGYPPTVVAGGLTPGNVGQAIAQIRPYGVDVSSGVESSRGVKDAELIRAFTAAVRKADTDH